MRSLLSWARTGRERRPRLGVGGHAGLSAQHEPDRAAPLFPVGGSLSPQRAAGVLSYVTAINPLSYGVDALWSTLIGMSHFGMTTDLLVLVAGAVVFTVIGGRLFGKIQA